MLTAWFVLLTLVVIAIAASVLRSTSTTITRSRFGRLAKIGRLSARLWTSWLGASIRRRFTSKERRAAYDEARRRADAEAVVQTMGQMKGAFMKLGQMLSFVSDDVPAEYRAALQSLQAKAPPMDFALIRDVAERSLGKPLERAFARMALLHVVVDQSHRLHEGVDGGRSDEAPAPLLEVFRHRHRLGRGGHRAQCFVGDAAWPRGRVGLEAPGVGGQ